jgi:hypothetical protein
MGIHLDTNFLINPKGGAKNAVQKVGYMIRKSIHPMVWNIDIERKGLNFWGQYSAD